MTLEVSRLSRSTQQLCEIVNIKSAIYHRVKDMGDIDFIIDTLENGEIRTFYECQWYPECLYLLAMLDHISKLNDIPLCSDFDDLRRYKLSRVIYPRDVLLLCALFHNDDAMRQAEEDAIPEFRQYNIIESDIRNVV